MDAPPMLTTTEFATALKVSRKTVHRWVQAGDVRAVKLPGRRVTLRIPQVELDRLLKSADRTAPAETAA
jgi:excisionase family DNA binding protein